MTKVLFLLSAVVMAVACFFSYQNRAAFVVSRNAKDANNVAINKELKALGGIRQELETVGGQRDTMEGEYKQEFERFEQGKIRFKTAQMDNERTSSDLANSVTEIKELKERVPVFPQGVTLETASEDIAKFKQVVAENELKAEKLKEDTVAREKDLKKEISEQDEVTKRLEERRRMFQRNSLVANVIAVNNDWGFVVIGSGRSQGITTDTRLIITRGNQTVCKLSIVSVESNKTVANIIQKTLQRGVTVAPGDRVILESLYQ